jgi:hypothetical protein
MSAVLPTPVVMTVNYNIVKFYYQFLDIVLFTSANIRVSLNDDTGVMQKQLIYKLEGQEYAAWGGDDQYIINLIISKIPGWVAPPPPPPTPTGTTGTTGTTGETGATGTNA